MLGASDAQEHHPGRPWSIRAPEPPAAASRVFPHQSTSPLCDAVIHCLLVATSTAEVSSWTALRGLLRDPQVLGWAWLAGAIFPAGRDGLEWMDFAACTTAADPDIWNPPTGRNHRPAKAICARCEVLEDCRLYAERVEALEGANLPGVWGGKSERERRREHPPTSRRRRVSRPSDSGLPKLERRRDYMREWRERRRGPSDITGVPVSARLGPGVEQGTGEGALAHPGAA